MDKRAGVRGQKVHAQLNGSGTGVVCAVISSIFVLGEVSELLSGARQVVHAEEGLRLVCFLSFSTKALSVFPGLRGDCKMTVKDSAHSSSWIEGRQRCGRDRALSCAPRVEPLWLWGWNQAENFLGRPWPQTSVWPGAGHRCNSSRTSSIFSMLVVTRAIKQQETPSLPGNRREGTGGR